MGFNGIYITEEIYWEFMGYSGINQPHVPFSFKKHGRKIVLSFDQNAPLFTVCHVRLPKGTAGSLTRWTAKSFETG